MVYNNIPTEWRRGIGGLAENSKLEYQAAAAGVDAGLIRKTGNRQIVTYDVIHEKTRTLPKSQLVKPQRNRDRGFYTDKTETPVQMKIKNQDLNTLVTPGFSTGIQYRKKQNRVFENISSKNSITSEHRTKDSVNIISQLNNITRVEPKKSLYKAPLFDPDREITNFTPISIIDQPVIRISRVE